MNAPDLGAKENYEVITVSIPTQAASSGASFEDLRVWLERVSGLTVSASTLYDWIVHVCYLRSPSDGVYKSKYTRNDFEWLLRWVAIKQSSKRYEARQKFQQFLQQVAQS